jgi:hypothetical protein
MTIPDFGRWRTPVGRFQVSQVFESFRLATFFEKMATANAFWQAGAGIFALPEILSL